MYKTTYRRDSFLSESFIDRNNLFPDGNNKESWAVNLKSSDYELLCPEGGRAKVEDYAKCNLAHAPPHMVCEINLNLLISTQELFIGCYR